MLAHGQMAITDGERGDMLALVGHMEMGGLVDDTLRHCPAGSSIASNRTNAIGRPAGKHTAGLEVGEVDLPVVAAGDLGVGAQSAADFPTGGVQVLGVPGR
jgi:hypothetical protein